MISNLLKFFIPSFVACTLSTAVSPQKISLSSEICENEDHKSLFIRTLAMNAGLNPELIRSINFNSRSSSTIYKLKDPFDETLWLKFSNKQGHNGAFRLKPLETGDTTKYEHGKERRDQVRLLIHWINDSSKRTVVPSPLPLNEDGSFEYRVTNCKEIPHLDNTIMTLWKDSPNTHFLCKNPPFVWEPSYYDAKDLRSMVGTLFSIQKIAKIWIDSQGDPEQTKKLLVHEYYDLSSFDSIKDPILSSLGITNFSLKEIVEELDDPESDVRKALFQNAVKKKEEIEKILNRIDPEAFNVQEAADRFLNTQSPRGETFKHEKEKPFFERPSLFIDLFRAERESGWSQEILQKGRRISQLYLANEIVTDLLENQGVKTMAFLKELLQLKTYLDEVECFPKGIVHNDAHPYQFVVTKDGPVLMDPLNISFGNAFADISNEHLYKLTRAYSKGTLSEEETLNRLEAVLIPEWIQHHGPNLLKYNLAYTWNLSESFALALGLEEKDAPRINLAFSIDSFLEELSERKSLERIYRESLFPKATLY